MRLCMMRGNSSGRRHRIKTMKWDDFAKILAGAYPGVTWKRGFSRSGDVPDSYPVALQKGFMFPAV